MPLLSPSYRRKKSKTTSIRKQLSGAKHKNGLDKHKDTTTAATAVAALTTNDTRRIISTDNHVINTMKWVFLSIIVAVAARQYFDNHPMNQTITSPATQTQHNDETIDRFLTWLKNNGAYISPSVSISSFPAYGGYGLIALPQTSSHHHTNDSFTVRALDEMFTIPSSIITTTASILHKTTYRDIPSFATRLQRTIATHFPSSPLVQQDIIIALQLMTECAMADSSLLKPYLDLLPTEPVPRLDTFNDEELTALQDVDLASLARSSFHSLREFWNQPEPRILLQSMIDATLTVRSPTTKKTAYATTDLADDPNNNNDGICTSFHSFHKYVTIVSSRAMVLEGIKYLTPLADMANYAPHPSSTPNTSVPPFSVYHAVDPSSGSITVRADRDIREYEQIFEDYGDVDDSLFLEAHGFVPDVNPRHCAVIPDRYLVVNAPEALRPSELWDAAVILGLARPKSSDGGKYLPLVCVREDGGIADERVRGYLALASLASDKNTVQASRCVDAVGVGGGDGVGGGWRRDPELIRLECLEYTGYAAVVRHVVRESARRTICGSISTLEEDVILLDSVVNKRHEPKMTDVSGTHRMETALKFRIADKRILAHVGEIEDTGWCRTMEHDSTIEREQEELSVTNGLEPEPEPESKTLQQSSELKPFSDSLQDHERLSESLDRFNTFLNTLDTPIRKIKPALVGDGMRIGAVATEELSIGDVYLSIDSAATMSVETDATPSTTKPIQQNIESLLLRYRTRQHDYNGGFDGLLFLLMYETFAAKERSRWSPYLDLLPSVSELKRWSPLMFEDEGEGDGDMFDVLAGSDVRRRLIGYRRKARSRYRQFVLDYDVVMTLGGIEKVTEENYLWAHSIIDSRSIWWDSKRHLVPLLDLVNCSELKDHNGVPAAPHRTSVSMSDSMIAYAATAASIAHHLGAQVYENYAQPNYIYLLHHGFTLDENSQDCALWEDAGDDDGLLRIGSDDPAAKDPMATRARLVLNDLRHSLPSPSFCIKEDGLSSLNDVANFVRIKLGMEGDNLGITMNDVEGRKVADYIEEALSVRLDRYKKLSDRRQMGRGRVGLRSLFRNAMDAVITREISFFQKAYDDLREMRLKIEPK